MTNLLFVYGSLRKGRANHIILSQHSPAYLGVGYIKGTLHNPIKLKLKGDNNVEGELYLVPNQAWESLDRLEGNGFIYERTIVDVHLHDAIIQAWVYEYIWR